MIDTFRIVLFTTEDTEVTEENRKYSMQNEQCKMFKAEHLLGIYQFMGLFSANSVPSVVSIFFPHQ